MYSSIIVFMYTMPTQTVNSITLHFIITIYFIIGSKLEERRMISEHNNYTDYCQRVPAFIPGCKRNNYRP